MKKILIIILVVGIGFLVALWINNTPKTEAPVLDSTLPAEVSNEGDASTESIDTSSKLPTKSETNKITIKNGMKIEIIKEGTGAEVTNGQTATVDYVGKLTDGTTFDASKNHGNTGFSFTLGAGQVIKGWDQGVLGMKVGEVRMLTIPSELGYGASGAGAVIPPNATLIFEVTLLAIK